MLRLKTLSTRRLSVTDHALDAGEGAAQRALDLVDALMHPDHAHRGGGAAMEVDDLAGLGVAHPHIMDVVDGAVGGELRQRSLDGGDAVGRGVGAVRKLRLQRLDMGVDLDVLAELLADVALEVVGDVVGVDQRHLAVDLEVDADDQLFAEVVHRDVVHGKAGIAGDHHDALTHALVVAGYRHRGKGEIGVAERLADGGLRLALDLLDAVDRIGARHFCDGVDEIGRPDHAHAHALDADDARYPADRGFRLLGYAFGGAIEQGFDGGAGHLQAEEAYHHGNRDGSHRVAPPEAEACEDKTGDDGKRAEHVGGKMQRIGRERLAARLPRGAMQRPGAPEVHGDVDDKHDEGNRRNGRWRRALAQAA